MMMEIHEWFVLLEIPQHARSRSSQHDARQQLTRNITDIMSCEETLQYSVKHRHSGKRPRGTTCFIQQISR